MINELIWCNNDLTTGVIFNKNVKGYSSGSHNHFTRTGCNNNIMITLITPKLTQQLIIKLIGYYLSLNIYGNMEDKYGMAYMEELR